MKFLFGLLFVAGCFSLVIGLITKEAIEMLRNYERQCVRQSGVALEHLEMTRMDRKIYEDEHQEDFAVCMLKKFNIMNTDGSINKDTESYLLLTDNPLSFQTAQDCTALAGANVRETARKIMTCLLQTDIIVMDPRPPKSLP